MELKVNKSLWLLSLTFLCSSSLFSQARQPNAPAPGPSSVSEQYIPPAQQQQTPPAQQTQPAQQPQYAPPAQQQQYNPPVQQQYAQPAQQQQNPQAGQLPPTSHEGVNQQYIPTTAQPATAPARNMSPQQQAKGNSLHHLLPSLRYLLLLERPQINKFTIPNRALSASKTANGSEATIFIIFQEI